MAILPIAGQKVDVLVKVRNIVGALDQVEPAGQAVMQRLAENLLGRQLGVWLGGQPGRNSRAETATSAQCWMSSDFMRTRQRAGVCELGVLVSQYHGTQCTMVPYTSIWYFNMAIPWYNTITCVAKYCHIAILQC
jgi:hypothetical protein